MKKSLVALAVLAASGAAMAQSSVTLFGVVDAAVGHYSVSGGNSVTALVSSGYNSSRLGFRGTEDLGGGLAASFWLEAGLNNDNGSFGTTATSGASTSTTGGGGLVFNRRSTVSLSGGFGEVRLGRDYTPTFWNDTIFDPFGTNGVGTNIISTVSGTVAGASLQSTYVRSSNTVAYFLPPNLGGFYGQVQYGFDEQSLPAAGNYGRYEGLRLGYAAGPLNVAGAWGKTNGVPGTGGVDVTYWNLGGQWDFGMLKLMGEYNRQKVDVTNLFSGSLSGYLVGVSVPVGPGEIRAAYSRVKDNDSVISANGHASKLALGYVHNLSKRTALYATYAHVSNSGTAFVAGGSNGYTAPAGIIGQGSNGYEFGVRHSF